MENTKEENSFFVDYSNLIKSIEAIAKTKEGYGYTYLELTPLLDIVMPKMYANNFTLIQTVKRQEGSFNREIIEPAIYENKKTGERKIEGEVRKKIETPAYVLHSELIHKSGEKIECDMPLYVDDIDPQAIGSAETYMRRYSIYTLLHIKVKDNDGLDASQKGKNNQKKAEAKEPLPEDVNQWATFLANQEDPKQYYWDVKNSTKIDEKAKYKLVGIIYPK